MAEHILSASGGAFIYFLVKTFVLPGLPQECNRGRRFHCGLLAVSIIFMATLPLWCHSLPEILSAAGIAACSLIIITTDGTCYWIPDSVIMALFVINGLLLAGQFITVNILVVILVMAFFAGLYLVFPRGIGSGDVKLVFALALGCPGNTAYIMVLTAFVLAMCGGITLWGLKRQTVLPFGPYLLAGWWCAAAIGEEWLQWILLI